MKHLKYYDSILDASGKFVDTPSTIYVNGAGVSKYVAQDGEYAEINEDGYIQESVVYDYLSFTAVDQASSISMRINANNAPIIYYSFNKLSWTQWDFNTISLAVGLSVYMYGTNPNGINNSNAFADCNIFVMSGKIKAGGDVQYLLNKTYTSSINSENCFCNLFRSCSSLIAAPKLSATKLAPYCYRTMFYECSSLEVAPKLPALKLEEGCYYCMFINCSHLKSITTLATDISASNCTNSWLSGTASTGTFRYNYNTVYSNNVTGIPTNWVEYEADDYLRFTAYELLSSVKITNYGDNAPTIYYSFDKENWKLWDYTDIYLTHNHSVYMYGDNPNGFNFSATKYSNFEMTGKIKAYGDIQSLISKDFPDTIPNECCFTNLFLNCKSLIRAPKLTATNLTNKAYQFLFQNTGLIYAPALPATTIPYACYEGLFYNCSSLIYPPDLPATSLQMHCYTNMFRYCIKLAYAPALPATNLANYCYHSMFRSCTSLDKAPVLPATTLVDHCYDEMFEECTSLNYIKSLATDISATDCLRDWLKNANTSGEFYKDSSTTYNAGINGVPSGWTQHNADIDKYLRFTADGQASTIGMTNNESNAPVIYYSFDCSTWTLWDYSTISLTSGLTVYMYGNNPTGISSSTTKYSKFTMSGKIKAGGNILSLISLDCPTTLTGNYAFYALFIDCTALYEAPRLEILTFANNSWMCEAMFCSCTNLIKGPILPSKLVRGAGYARMFYNCSNLTIAPALPTMNLGVLTWLYNSMFTCCSKLEVAPELPAIKVGQRTYNYMFLSCSSLIDAPDLPARLLNDYSYTGMFSGCTKITSAPTLPALKLGIYCYNLMFYNCTNLKYASELPATNLTASCYRYMFYNCTNLKYAPKLPVTTLSPYCYANMFDGCANLISTPELPAMSLADNCYNHMFYNCSNLSSAAKYLPATQLTNACYTNMFEGCANLIKAPILCAEILTTKCYNYMFQNCSKLRYVATYATDISAEDCLSNWLKGAISGGEFYKQPSTVYPSGSDVGIPASWTVHSIEDI